MTDLNTMTKPTINALLTTPLSTYAVKETSKYDLIAMFDAMPATDALDADLRNARADDEPTPPASKARKPRILADRVMIEPGKPEDVKATKAGSKLHLMAEALAKGATIEELVE